MDAMTGIVVAVCRSPTHTMTKPDRRTHPPGGRARRRGRRAPGRDGQAPLAGRAGPGGTPNLRQVHLIHAELFDELRAAGFAVSPGLMGENVTTRGVDLLGLPTGARLHLGQRGGGRGDRAAQPVPPARRAAARADGRDPGARRRRQPRPQGRHHGDRAGKAARSATATRSRSNCRPSRTGRSQPV